MDRRTALRAFLGAAAFTAGGSLLLPRTAEALPGATALPDLNITPTPAVATEADVAAARVQNVWHWGRPHWGGRRVIIVRPGYGYGWRRRRWGGPVRCWINRWGERVCRRVW